MSSLEHGRALRTHRRYEEAEAAFREALAADPINPDLHFELAQTLFQAPGKEQTQAALQSINRAIGLEPDSMWSHALKSHILSDLEKYKEATKSAKEALAIEPNPYAWIARAQALAGLQRWAAAEAACDQALAIDPDETGAQNLRATLTRLQGRLTESRETIATVLARDAEDPHALENAGFTALQAGERDAAESFFLEALRIDAKSESARDGLLECLKARSRIYKPFYNLRTFLTRFSPVERLGFITIPVALLLLAQILIGKIGILTAALNAFLGIAMWMLYCGFVATALGHAHIAMDRKARRCLHSREIMDGWVVASPIALGLLFWIIGVSHGKEVFLAGFLLIGSAIPFSRVFRNGSRFGSFLFAAIGLFVVLVSLRVAVETISGRTLLPKYPWDPSTAALFIFLAVGLAALDGFNKPLENLA